jgi:hypothetical protein
MTNRIDRAFKVFVDVNRLALLREYSAYGSNPNIDYCPADGGCKHHHTFESYCRAEFQEYQRQIQDDTPGSYCRACHADHDPVECLKNALKNPNPVRNGE